jgi:NHL repeat
MLNRMFPIISALLLLTLSATDAGAGEPGFSSKPRASRAGDKVKISFAVSQSTDVEVAILDAAGKILRRLGAGVLGENSPLPFKKGLAQELTWDGRDDRGKSVSARGVRVRVALGLKARLDRIIGWSGQNVDSPQGIACGPDGTLYVAYGHNLTAHAFSSVISAFDSQGKYLRQVVPGPAGLPASKRQGWPRMKGPDGKELPLVQHVLSRSTLPAFSFGWGCSMAVTGDGRLLMVNAKNAKVKHPDIGGARRLLVVGTDGSVPADYAKRKVASQWYSGAAYVAVSPDNRFAYITSLADRGRKGKGSCQVVWRHSLTEVKPPEVFIGRMFAKPEKKSDLRGPAGIAVDAVGNIYVADRGRNRIAVYKPDGSFLKEIPIKNPFMVKVSRKTGAIYVSIVGAVTVRGRKGSATTKIIKLGSLAKPGQIAAWATPRKYSNGSRPIALDDSGDAPAIWYCGYVWGGSKMFRIQDCGISFKEVDHAFKKGSGNSLAFNDQVSVVGRKVLSGHPGFGWRKDSYCAFDALTGKSLGFYRPRDAKGRPIGASKLTYGDTRGGGDGLFYVHKGGGLLRFGADGKAVPFKAKGSNKTTGNIGHPHTRASGHFVRPTGDAYVLSMEIYLKDKNRKHSWSWSGMNVRHFGPDGNVEKESLLVTNKTRLAGIAVDSRGNIYVGAQVSPGGKRIPPWAFKCFPKGTNRHVRKMYEMYGTLIKFPPRGGKIVPAGDGKWSARYVRGGRTNVKLKNSIWTRRAGLIPAKNDLGCYCETSRFDIDGFDRLFVPDVFRFSVQVLDSAGNEITRIGRYGNMDSRGPGSPAPTPEIGFAWPIQVDCAHDRVYVADLLNRRVVAVRFEHALAEECAVQ